MEIIDIIACLSWILFFMGYTWVNKTSDDTVLAAHVNDLQDEKTDKDTVENNINDHVSFSDAIDSIGATESTLLINDQQNVLADKTVPSNVTIRFLHGGSLNISLGKTVTINGHVEAGLYQIFEGAGAVLFGDGITEGLRPEWWGARADDLAGSAAANVAAFAACNLSGMTGILPYGVKRNILLSQGVYQVTALVDNFALDINCPIVGQGADVSIIKNVGTGSALRIEGVNGEIHYSRFKDFSVVGHAGSQDGIYLNPDADINEAVGYCVFENVDSHHHGRHGLIHRYSWATKYNNCKFIQNGGLGVYLFAGATTQHNNIIFRDCDSRANGGVGNNSADFTKGGVRISGEAQVYWIGGVVESNNAWGFIIGEDVAVTSEYSKIVIKEAYGEGHPMAAHASVTGGFLYLSQYYGDVKVHDNAIAYGATAGKTGYAFYIADPTRITPGFQEWNNLVNPDLRPGTAIRDSGLVFAEKWRSAFELISLQNDRDFGGANHWVNGSFLTFDSAGDLSVTANGVQFCTLPQSNINNGMGLVYGKRYGIRYDVAGAGGVIYFGGISALTRLPILINGAGQTHEFIWLETGANQSFFLWGENGSSADIDNISIYEIDGGVSPQGFLNGLLSTTIVSLAADADTAIYIVPTGKRVVLSHAILVAGDDAGATSTISIGSEAATYANFIPTNTLSNLDAEFDAVILHPIPNTTPLKIKSYAAATVIYAHIANNSGGVVNTLYLYGLVY